MRLMICILVLALSGPAALSQGRAPAPAPAAPAQPATPPVPDIDPVYHPRLERLAEVLGALHHLAPLCQPADAQVWRGEMQALLEAEQPTPGRRDRLVAAFNRGLTGLRDVHRTCTPNARLASDRYREEGTVLIRDLVARFSN